MAAEAYKILVIDDEEDLRENLKYVLQMKGYVVALAEDGVQGLKALETFLPDLIILDLNMPNMGGIEFYQKICVHDVPRFPVFVLTARANMEKFFKDFNVDGFMAKPFEITDLIREISYVINKKAAQTMAQSVTGPRKVFIVENNQSFSGKAGMELLGRGFTVNLALNGTEAIERVSKDVPDVICVNLNLPDIDGEMVIKKLKRMAKTSSIRSILYVTQVGENGEIVDKIQKKSVTEPWIEVNAAGALIQAIEEVLKNKGDV